MKKLLTAIGFIIWAGAASLFGGALASYVTDGRYLLTLSVAKPPLCCFVWHLIGLLGAGVIGFGLLEANHKP